MTGLVTVDSVIVLDADTIVIVVVLISAARSADLVLVSVMVFLTLARSLIIYFIDSTGRDTLVSNFDEPCRTYTFVVD